jgi:hypothetical protein
MREPTHLINKFVWLFPKDLDAKMEAKLNPTPTMQAARWMMYGQKRLF